ncbi:hypothetical protein, partial [uncultured Duncaniella sp.]|uniref:hypothetical protein n=1 Tax=uncultured Duncaniella sp. TaxID=2768039 RepID=UPI00272A6E5A
AEPMNFQDEMKQIFLRVAAGEVEPKEWEAWWNSNEQHMRLDMRMPYVSVSYNIQWGRQKCGADKIINADATIEKTTAGGR